MILAGCLSAKYTDMAYAYGVFSLQGQGSLDQIYIGWKSIYKTAENPIASLFSGDTTNGIKIFWERMGYGDSVREALEYTSGHGTPKSILSLWGLNVRTDLGDVDGDDNIFVWGLGFINLNQIELEP